MCVCVKHFSELVHAVARLREREREWREEGKELFSREWIHSLRKPFSWCKKCSIPQIQHPHGSYSIILCCQCGKYRSITASIAQQMVVLFNCMQSIITTLLQGSLCMVILRDFLLIVHCLGWLCNDPCTCSTAEQVTLSHQSVPLPSFDYLPGSPSISDGNGRCRAWHSLQL